MLQPQYLDCYKMWTRVWGRCNKLQASHVQAPKREMFEQQLQMANLHFLPEPLEVSEVVRPIGLAGAEPEVGAVCEMAGWGKLEGGILEG